MKYLIISILMSIILSANNFDKNKEFEQLKHTYTPKVIEKQFSDFVKITGDSKENFLKYVDIFRNDIHSLRFLKISHETNMETTININNEKRVVQIPNYKKALQELSQIKSDNILGAYAAVSYISEHLFNMDTSGKFINNELKGLINKYYKRPLKLLMAKHYCYAYLMASNYLSPKTYFIEKNKKTYYLFKSITTKGFKKCRADKDKIPKFLVKNMDHGYAYLIAYEKLYGKNHK